jgi:GntR family transcriptional regulator
MVLQRVARPDRHGAAADIRVPVYARIQQDIRDGVTSGVYAPGGRIPSEPELAKRFGTTRATVAHALQELVFDGTIVRRAGSGSFVAQRAPSVALDARRLRSFEEQAAETGETVSYRMVSFRQETATPDAAAGLGVGPASSIYHLERVRLINGVPLSLESRMIPVEIGGRLAADDLACRSIHDILEKGLGLRIIRIQASVLPGIATARVGRLLEIARGRPLLIRDHVLIGLEGRPLIVGRSLYTEHFRIQYVVHEGEGGT